MVRIRSIRGIHVKRIVVKHGVRRIYHGLPVGCSNLWEMVITRLDVHRKIKVLGITLSLELRVHTIVREASPILN